MVCYGIFWSGQYQNIGRVPPGSYWSQDPHILLVGIPVLACAREEFVPAHQNGALVRKARCDVTTT